MKARIIQYRKECEYFLGTFSGFTYLMRWNKGKMLYWTSWKHNTNPQFSADWQNCNRNKKGSPIDGNVGMPHAWETISEKTAREQFPKAFEK